MRECFAYDCPTCTEPIPFPIHWTFSPAIPQTRDYPGDEASVEVIVDETTCACGHVPSAAMLADVAEAFRTHLSMEGEPCSDR